MAEKNKNTNGNKPSKKMRIIELASFVKRNLNFRIDGLTNHMDKIGITWSDKNKRHLCHIMKVSEMIDFQIETFEELKQLVLRINPANNEISIQEKRKRCFELTNQLEKEIRACGLYDVLFKSNNSVDKDPQFLNFIQSHWHYGYVNDRIRDWKKLVYDCMQNGEIGPNTWAKYYILNVAKKHGINDDVIGKWSRLINEAYQWNCKYTAAETRYKICNCLLFEMQSSDESKELKRDLRWVLGEESDAYSPPDNLPDDYFLIKSGIIKSLDEFIEIMQLCIDNEIYLYLDMVKFREIIIKRLIGEKEFFKMLESADPKQIEKILNIDRKMDEICKSVYGVAGCTSTFREFLYSSRNSKAVEKIISCAVKDEKLFSVLFNRVGFYLDKFCDNHLQISVETFEQFMAKGNGNIVCHLSKGLKLCSDDIKTNNKKIDLGHIFSDWSVFSKMMHRNLGWWQEDFYSDDTINFLNLVFKNIDKIKLDDKQITDFLFGKIDNTSELKVANFMDVLCYYTNGPAAKTYPSNKLAKIAIVINAILKKQNLKYNGESMQKRFETRCKEIGINVSCDRDDIFFVNKTLYVVDKDTGITQFGDALVFCQYIYQNINTEKGDKYAGLLNRYICAKNDFSIYDYGEYNIIDNHYLYIICLILAALKNHDDTKLKIEKLYVDTIESKFKWFCFKLYQFFVFPIASRINADISQFYSTITFNDNQNMISENKTEISEISTVPELEIKTSPNQSQEQSVN